MARTIDNARVLYLGPSDLNQQVGRGKIYPKHIRDIGAFDNADVVIYRDTQYPTDVQLLKSGS